MKKIISEEYAGVEKWVDLHGIKSKKENYKVRYYYHFSLLDKETYRYSNL